MDQPDFERPLNKRGERDAPEMGKRFARRKLAFDRILCSPAQRARSTWAGVAQGLGAGVDADVEYVEAIYEASPQTLLTLIQSRPDSESSLLVIGHNPGMESLANSLSPEPVGHIPTCAATHLRFDTQCWADIARAEPELLFYDFPKKKAEL